MVVTMDSQISFALIISTVTLIICIYNFFNGRKKDIQDDNKQLTRIELQLDSIQKDVGETKESLKRINDQIIDIIRVQTIHDSEIKSLWREVHKIEHEEKENEEE